MYEMDCQLETYVNECTAKQLRAKTLKSYMATIRLFSDYMREKYEITSFSKVTQSHITAYIAYLQERGKYTVSSPNYPQNRGDYGKTISVTTINNYIRNLRAFFNYLYEEHEIRKNPMERVRQLPNGRKPLDFVSDEDFINLLSHMDRSRFSEYRDYTVALTLIDTGMRIGECLLTKIEHVDLVRKSIFIPFENTKGGKSRTVFFSDEVKRQLKAWIKYQDAIYQSEYLFCTNQGKSLAVNNFEKNFRKYAKRVGLDGLHPHVLRNNFAKRFLLNGGNILILSRLLGHSSVTVTEKAYLDLNDDDLRESYQKFSPVNNMNKHY